MTFRSTHRSAVAALTGVALAGVSLSMASAALAQTPARPPAPAARLPAPAAASEFELKGFRSATFGMTQAQVRGAIAADFGAAAVAKIVENANVADGTRVMQVAVDHLDPGPAGAQIIYIFGASSKALISINVVWTVPGEPTAVQRDEVMAAGVQLANYFKTLPSPPKQNASMAAISPNGVLLFAGTDKKNAGVEVAADGVTFQTTGPDNKPVSSPTPKGPATLRVSYFANTTNPDVMKIKPGSF